MTYYIRLGDDYLILDSHKSISVTYPAKTTSHPTHRRENRADNYMRGNPTASILGIITDVQSASPQNTRGAGGYIDKLLEFMDAQKPLALKHRLDGEEEDNWFITNFSPSQDNQNGYGAITRDGDVVQSFKVSLTLERVDLAEGVVASVEVPKAYIDALQVKGSGSSSTATYDKTTPKGLLGSEKTQLIIDESISRSGGYRKSAEAKLEAIEDE